LYSAPAAFFAIVSL